MSIYKKLLAIQKKVGGLGKDKDTKNQYNPHGYKYVTGDKVLGILRPLMDEQGLILKQEIISIENTRMDYLAGKDLKQKSEILSKVTMKFTWVDTETGEKDENLFGANGQNDWEKGLGSALTYGERYFLLKYFHIPTDEDDIDNDKRKVQSESQPLPKVINKINFTPEHRSFKEAHRKISTGEGSVEKLRETFIISEEHAKLLNSPYNG